MKNFIKLFAIILALCAQVGCHEKKSTDEIHFGTSADYPPFEYKSMDKIIGFDIDLASCIADELGKKAVFHDMSFSSVLPSLQNGTIDAAISTIAVTEKRSAQYDFSQQYFFEEMFLVFDRKHPVKDDGDLRGKKIACQLGTTMEFWLRENAKSSEITAMDNNNQAIEAVKAGLMDAVLMDGFQAQIFCEKNNQLGCSFLVKSGDGYGIAFRKNSPLCGQINQILHKFTADGTLEKLAKKWKIR
ncbi:MAG: ABC transporter substrate-binding protein [Puniceicoccales bacterium]|jgi:polar amino acid transport system substrate-binding protein|nr:ABC transporter substrate-binding protein [Puniceicoccales bacterium]